MKKIEINRLDSTEGGVNCFLVGIAVGVSILSGNPFSMIITGIGAYNSGCLT